MLTGLLITAFLMGLGGAPHCAAMCGVACYTYLGRAPSLWALMGRLLGYSVLGAIGASGSSAISSWSKQSALLHPLWVLALLGSCMLGVWLMWQGRVPPVIDRLGRDLYRNLQVRLMRVTWVQDGRVPAFVSSFLSGMAWAALPCGLLYGAVTVASLSNTAFQGALVMLAFALPGSVGLIIPGALFKKLKTKSVDQLDQCVSAPLDESPSKVGAIHEVAIRFAPPSGSLRDVQNPQWAVRLSGAMLLMMSAWAFQHRLVDQWNQWCA